jgi:glucose/arabinose dehydrogenase
MLRGISPLQVSGPDHCAIGLANRDRSTQIAGMLRTLLAVVSAVAFAACTPTPSSSIEDGSAELGSNSAGIHVFRVTEQGRFNEGWAMTFLPGGALLVTEKAGKLKLRRSSGTVQEITGVPAVAYGGQGGLGDVVLHPQFSQNNRVYLSWAESGPNGTSGAAVGHATLALTATGGRLTDLEVIWRQTPKVTGQGHYGHRLAFDSSGYLWITSGDRQKFTPAQDLTQTLGKVIRLNDDGTVPPSNPFASRGGVAAQIWSLGHRNPLGIAFDAAGNLWTHEMGPQGGDEVNLIQRGSNYGWPLVSNGDHYDGSPIPDHDTRPDLNAPEISWNPVIAPAGFVIYSGTLFPRWEGNGLLGGLVSEGLVRVSLSGARREIERFSLGERIREVEQGPDGALWVLEDGVNKRLLKLTPE